MSIPKKYMKMVGTEQKFSGGLFSGKKAIKPANFKVMDIRHGTAVVINVKEFTETGKSSFAHPTFELLLKNDTMKRAQWSRPFPIREINIKNWPDG